MTVYSCESNRSATQTGLRPITLEEKSIKQRRGERVSVIMPVRNEGRYLGEALDSLYSNDLEGIELEVIVVDGMSTDGTREVVRERQEEFPRLRLLDNPLKVVPHAMNLGLTASTGSVVIRIDGHAAVARDFIRSCIEELERHPECGCVGGVIKNVDSGNVAKAVSLAMSSPFGVGNARFRVGGYQGYVDTVAFGAYRRKVFEQLGMFDEALVRNQDDEFNYRMNKAGYRIWLSDRIHCRYVVRASFAKLFRQYYQYGYWKVYVNLKHRTITNYRQLAPTSFLAFLVVVAVVSLVWPPSDYLLDSALLGYLTCASRFALVKTRRIAELLRVIAAFSVMHLGYGLGYLLGLFDFGLLRRAPRRSSRQLSR